MTQLSRAQAPLRRASGATLKDTENILYFGEWIDKNPDKALKVPPIPRAYMHSMYRQYQSHQITKQDIHKDFISRIKMA